MKVVSASLRARGTIRVTYSKPPLTANPQRSDDALNPLNYVLSGPGSLVIVDVQVAYNDPASVDLFANGVLAAGPWVVACAPTIATYDGEMLEAGATATVTVLPTDVLTGPAGGAEDLGSADRLRRYLNPGLKGKGWDSIIAGIAVGEEANSSNGASAFDQLFLASAGGSYLEQRAGDRGIPKPANVGLLDNDFRNYALRRGSRQLVQDGLLEVLEVFFGEDGVRASALSDGVEPFEVSSGDDLTFQLDRDTTVLLVLEDADVAVPGAATAVEVAAAIDRAIRAAGQQLARAVPYFDPISGQTHVKIVSGSVGLASSVQVTGGTMQHALRLPASVFTHADGTFPTWTVTHDSTTGRTRFAASTPADLTFVYEGDYVVVYGDDWSVFNVGSFPIVETHYDVVGGVTTQWFEVVSDGVGEVVTPLNPFAITVWRPTTLTTHAAGDREVIVAQTGDGLHVVVPATSEAVKREPPYGSYLHEAPGSVITSIERVDGLVTVNLATELGLAVGDLILVDDVRPVVTKPAAVAQTGSETSYDFVDHMDAYQGVGWTNNVKQGVCRFADGTAIMVGGRAFGPGGGTLTFTISNRTLVDGRPRYDWGQVAATPRPISASSLGLTAVRDGLVLATGGNDDTVAYADCHLFDGTSWANAASMPSTRTAHGQVNLVDGRVFVAGGASAITGTTTLVTSALYNPHTDAWTASGSMAQSRMDHTLTVLADGRVLAAGGRRLALASLVDYSDPTVIADVGTGVSSSEVYDVGTGTWSQLAAMSYQRFGHAACLMGDGRVLVVGGYGKPATQTPTAYAPVPFAEIYDPTTNRWYGAGRTPATWPLGTSAVYLASRNLVMVVGSADQKVWFYAPTTGRWFTEGLRFSAPRQGVKAVIVDSFDDVMMMGGENPTGPSFDGLQWLLVLASAGWVAGDLNGERRVESVAEGQFTFKTLTTTYTLGQNNVGTLTPVAAPVDSWAGPYALDPVSGLALRSVDTTTPNKILQGTRLAQLEVADATGFADEPGYVVVGLGYAYQTVVKYLGRLSDNLLALDYSFTWPHEVPAGAVVTLLSHKGPYAGQEDGTPIGAMYLTDSPSGRVAALQAVTAMLAAGVPLDVTIRYPGDRGLAGEGLPTRSNYRLSDVVAVWGSSEPDADMEAARNE